MKAIVVTTITSTFDVDTFEAAHRVDVDDQDGLSEISSEVLGSLLVGALGSSLRAVREAYPHVAEREARLAEQEADDEE